MPNGKTEWSHILYLMIKNELVDPRASLAMLGTRPRNARSRIKRVRIASTRAAV